MNQDSFQIIITSQPEAAVIALNEIQKLDPAARGRRLSPEVQLVESPGGYAALLAALPNTIFIRHVFPVHAIYSATDNNLTCHLIDLCSRILKNEALSIQLRDASGAISPDTKVMLQAVEQDLLQQGHAFDNKNPVWVLSLYIHEDSLYAGVSSCVNNLSDWNGGVHRLKKSEQFVSRAEFKLEEAIASFGVDMVGQEAGKKAIDLGAAPGGWTKILLQHGFHVTAVDPGAMSEIIVNDSNLVHFRDVAQKFPGQAGAYDMLVNDMRMDMVESCEIMLDMAHFLIPSGIALMTLKLPHSQWYKHTKRAIALLQKKYVLLNARQLFHNRSEVMVYLRKAGG